MYLLGNRFLLYYTSGVARMADCEIAYLDESYDDQSFALSALVVPVPVWRETFELVKGWRRLLREQYGIFVNKELHATTFVSGHGRVGHRVVPKGLRAHSFRDSMDMIAQLPIRIISGCWTVPGRADPNAHAFGRIQERLQTRCRKQDRYITIIADEGRAAELRKVSRRSTVHNPVGSRFGGWEDGASWKNIPNDRLIEDPVFRNSAESYFLQFVDFVAFALLKSEVPPTPLVKRYGLATAYERLGPVLATEASSNDPRRLGIVRT